MVNNRVSPSELVKGTSYRCYAKSPMGENNDVNLFMGFSQNNEPLFTNDRFKDNFVLDPQTWSFFRV